MSLSDTAQGFKIVCVDCTKSSFQQEIEACVQFEYKGFVISMSTAGKLHGGCLREVVVFDHNKNTLKLAHSVEEAIDFVNNIQ